MRRSGRAVGIKCKNVELGVLFHSSPARAYYAEPLPGCCRQGGRGNSHSCGRARSPTPRPPSSFTWPAIPPHGAPVVPMVDAGRGSGRRSRRHMTAEAMVGVGGGVGTIEVPLPVPFRLDSEPYADEKLGSPHPRFLPFMHVLKEFPR